MAYLDELLAYAERHTTPDLLEFIQKIAWWGYEPQPLSRDAASTPGTTGENHREGAGTPAGTRGEKEQPCSSSPKLSMLGSAAGSAAEMRETRRDAEATRLPAGQRRAESPPLERRPDTPPGRGALPRNPSCAARVEEEPAALSATLERLAKPQ